MIQEYTGEAGLFQGHQWQQHTLCVAVECRLGDAPIAVHALLDTGADWCILPPELAEALGLDLTPDPNLLPYSTRLGPLAGRLERMHIQLVAEAGETLAVDATLFVSADWLGPPILGWQGCLSRIRFGLDPIADRFYFGQP